MHSPGKREQTEAQAGAALAAVVTFLREMGALLMGLLPADWQAAMVLPEWLPAGGGGPWRDALPAVCAVVFGLVCRCFVSSRAVAAEAGEEPEHPELDV